MLTSVKYLLLKFKRHGSFLPLPNDKKVNCAIWSRFQISQSRLYQSLYDLKTKAAIGAVCAIGN